MNRVSRFLAVMISLSVAVVALGACGGTAMESTSRDQKTTGTQASGAATSKGPNAPASSVSIVPKVIRVEVVDRTAGQSLSPEQRKAITEEIVKRAHSLDSAIEVSNREDQVIHGLFRAYIDVFTAGNRALRFWVGFGAGAAHLKFTAQWVNGTTKQVEDSKEFQRFGAASLRSGEAIEQQMTELIGEYSQQFLSSHVK